MLKIFLTTSPINLYLHKVYIFPVRHLQIVQERKICINIILNTQIFNKVPTKDKNLEIPFYDRNQVTKLRVG